jgi:hypothetical protein
MLGEPSAQSHGFYARRPRIGGVSLSNRGLRPAWQRTRSHGPAEARRRAMSRLSEGEVRVAPGTVGRLAGYLHIAGGSSLAG